MISSYQEAVKRMLKVDVVEGLFIEEMRYSGMTLSTLEDQMKVKYFGASFSLMVLAFICFFFALVLRPP